MATARTRMMNSHARKLAIHMHHSCNHRTSARWRPLLEGIARTLHKVLDMADHSIGHILPHTMMISARCPNHSRSAREKARSLVALRRKFQKQLRGARLCNDRLDREDIKHLGAHKCSEL